MDVMLSNYGHRRMQHLQRGAPDPDDQLPRLRAVLAAGKVSASGREALLEGGLLQPVPEGLDLAGIRLRYKRNPLEHASQVVFEYTTLCNLACAHCRNGSLTPVTERNLADLMRLVDVVIPLGITRFDFIGGEVLLYGVRWPELAAHIRAYPDTRVNMLTSGWFFGEADFWAAGARYADDRAFLAALRQLGVTHLTFSLDGPAQIHDACRKVPGLHDRILDGMARVHEAGITPQVSLLSFPGLPREEEARWFRALAGRLHPGLAPDVGAYRLRADPMNYMSHFINVGNGADLQRGRGLDPAEVPVEQIRCKNFFRPAPSLRFKATGELSLCPLIEAGDGYGNLHDIDPIALLNGMQDAFVYRLHAEDRLADYAPLVDAEVFAGSVGHVCSMRVIVTMLAQAIHTAGYAPDAVPASLLRRLNEQVARRVGHLPAEGPSPLGRSRPR